MLIVPGVGSFMGSLFEGPNAISLLSVLIGLAYHGAVAGLRALSD
jgi:hypothetical protein